MLRCTSRFVASAKIASIRAVCSSWTVVPIRRSISNDQNSCDSFPSLLKDLNVVSPFDDPARRQKISAIDDLSKIKELYSEEKCKDMNRFVEFISSENESLTSKDEGCGKQVLLELDVSNSDGIASLKSAAESDSNLAITGNHTSVTKQNTFWNSMQKKLHLENIDENASEEEKRNQRMRRNTKLGVIFGAGSIILGFTWFCIHYGKSPRDENGLATRDEFSGSLLAPFRRIRKHFHLWMDYVIEPSREVLLPSPIAPPYYQPKYTLVMELKNILVAPDWSYTSGYRFIKRPALDYFLTMIKYPNFEVVLYTSESAMSAHQLVESLDPDHCIMYKLYRDCTKYMNGHHVKVLSQLNRDMSKVIFIDHDPKSFQLNPENVLRIPKWEGNMDDTSLVDLAELLKTIHLSDVDDVRPTLQYYSQFDDPAKEFRRRAVELAEKEAEEKRHTSNDSLLKRYTGKLFGFRRHAVS